MKSFKRIAIVCMVVGVGYCFSNVASCEPQDTDNVKVVKKKSNDTDEGPA